MMVGNNGPFPFHRTISRLTGLTVGMFGLIVSGTWDFLLTINILSK